MITLPVYNTEGKEIDSLKIDPKIFDNSINVEAIYQAINAYRASQRKGLASVKGRGEVSGGGKKPWKQKGTGRARVGSTRSPLWRHGGVTFGPIPRDFSYAIPKKIKKIALRSALYAKIKDNSILVLESLKMDNHKTKEAAKIFSNLKINPRNTKVLLLINKIDKNLNLAFRNLDNLSLDLASNTNTYDILNANRVIITQEAVKGLLERIGR